MYIKNINSIKCPFCSKKLNKSWMPKHLKNDHNIERKSDLLLLSKAWNKSLSYFNDISEYTLKAYLKWIEKENGLKKRYDSQFFSFYKHITYVRNFNNEKDIEYFFKVILPWKLKHKFQCNNKELVKLEANGNKDYEEKIYRHFMLEKNPYYKHNGSFSPWSKDFIGYKNLTEKEKKVAIRKANRSDTKEYNTRVSYYLNRGYSEKEAINLLRKRQNTFSLKRCISDYGEENGYEIWKQRQIKWQKTLSLKPIEELRDINHRKISSGIGNKEETAFLKEIISDEKYHNVYIKNAKAIGDLVYKNKIIEFYGDYWHCNPKIWKATDYQKTIDMFAQERWNLDKQRQIRLEKLNYKVKIVWENDYKENKEKVIQECKDFLGI